MEKFGVKVVKSRDDGTQVIETVVMSKPKIIKLLNNVVPVEERWLWLRVVRNDDRVLNTFEVRHYGDVTDEQQNAVRTVFEGNDEVLNVLTFKRQRRYGKRVVQETVVPNREVEEDMSGLQVTEVEFDEVETVEVEDVEVEV